MENRKQEVGCVNLVAFEHTGFEDAELDDASGEVAQADFIDTDGALISCVGSGVEKRFIEILAQLVGRRAFGRAVYKPGRLPLHVCQK